MRWARGLLIAGGIFNCVMGLVFFSPQLLSLFLQLSIWAEHALFDRSAILPFPSVPVHLLLIHGFGAGALILGATLIVSARDPVRYLPFIFFDALGRLLYGGLMVVYIMRFALMRFMLVFAGLELFFGIAYLLITWKYSE